MSTTAMLYRHVRYLLLWLLLLAPGWLGAADWLYRIRAGETLGDIHARFVRADVSVARLQAHNRIENDRAIPVGTEILVPLEWLKQSPAAARVAFLRGEVKRYSRGSSDVSRLAQEDSLELGDRLVTGPHAVLSIRFADGSSLLLGPASELSLDTLSSYGESGMVDTRLRVQRGRVESRVKPLKGSGSRYEIHTPAAVTMVRGTGFRVNVEEGTGLTRSEVVEGGVQVSAGGESVTVEAGFGTLVEPGKAPEPPSKLLEAPDLSDLPPSLRADDPGLGWPALEGAEHYRLKLLASEPQDAVLVETQVETPAYRLQDQQPGSYRLLVRGIDAKGLEGLSAEHLFEILPAPVEIPPAPPSAPPVEDPRPVLEAPRFGPGWIDLRWSEVAGAWSYRLILARDRELREPLLERISSSRRLRLALPRPGRYYLRVDALLQEENRESHSMTYRVEIPWR